MAALVRRQHTTNSDARLQLVQTNSNVTAETDDVLLRTTNRAASRRVAERHGETHVPYRGLATLLAHLLALTY